MLTVLSWLWKQPGVMAPYSAGHVNIWAAMVRRHLRMPHRLAVVTDTPAGIEAGITIIPPPHDFETVRIATWGPGKPQCFRRLSMFRPDAGKIFGDRFVCMDLDCVISGELDTLFDRPEDLVLYKTPLADLPNPRPYNGSMLMMTAGARPEVFADFTLEGAAASGARYLGSDQAWISDRLGPGEATWSEDDGVRWWGRWRPDLMTRICFFPGHPKPMDLIPGHAWVRRNYNGGHRGRCLILGYGPTLWEDVMSALLEQTKFDAVIASPEAAEHWPGEVLTIATDDLEAERMAQIYGFTETIFCGRSPGQSS